MNNAGVEEASEWVFAHMEDPDFNDPPVAAAAAAPMRPPMAEHPEREERPIIRNTL